MINNSDTSTRNELLIEIPKFLQIHYFFVLTQVHTWNISVKDECSHDFIFIRF